MTALISILILIALIVGLKLLFTRLFPGFEWRLLLVTVPVILATWITVVAFRNYMDPTAEGKRFTLGVDLAGGSILVYEVDPAFWERQSDAFKREFSAEQLASRIKTRVDPSNLLETTIRPIQGDASRPPRVEIVLPISNDPKNKNSAGKIQEIKRLIQQQGQLEFRILAHNNSMPEFNDRDAINTAKTQLAGKADEIVLPGKTPPAPTGLEAEYEWLEMSASEIETLKQNFSAESPEGFRMIGDYAYFSAPKQRTIDIPESAPNLGRHFVLTRKPIADKALVTGDNMDPASIFPDMNNLQFVVRFGIKPDAQDRFFELTKEVKKLMAIIFDGKVISAPELQARLSTGGIITMGGSGAEAQRRVTDLARILQAGSLPAALKPEPASEMTMGPGLGEDTIRKGTLAVAGAFLAVCVFMMIYYRFAGFVAVAALFINLLLTVAFLAFANAAITLPGLAGLVLMLGMAIDANVLIYERLREERERGANFALAIRNAYDRALPTIIDTHITSIFTAIVLYAVGTDQLKGFGISLTMGLIISLFTSLYMTRLFFDIALSKGWLKNLSMMKLFSKPNFDFMRVRHYWFAATVILSILGVALFLYRGEEGLNIDFTGGTAYTFQFKEPKNISEVRSEIMKHPELPEPAVDALYRDATLGTGATREFTVRTTNKDAIKVRQAIESAFGKELLYVDAKTTDVTAVPPDKQDNEKRDQAFEITFSNKEPPAEEVAKFVNQWFAQHVPGSNKDFFHVKGITPGTRQGSFKTSRVEFKLPAELKNKAGDLVKYVVQQFSLPVSDRLENFDSQLAQETQGKALSAILLSWLAIVGYLWFRFGNWTFGVAAVLCLAHDLMFTVGIIAGCHYIVGMFGNVLLLEDFKLDLPAVAALLTLVGYSVNDTIVVFDRIREIRGKNPELTTAIINESVNGTLSRTILVSLATWLVVVVLYIFGGEGVKLFAFVMVVGVIIGTYSSIFVASPLLLLLGEGKPRTAPTGTTGRKQLQTASR
ncbi:MAG: protein translocase subunit SecD [Planctomycetia bacterium]|nr:protein translocase subunit SecD [Planctomycetia bacterium]